MRALPNPRRALLGALYGGLALLSGAESFTGRREPLRTAAAYHETAWRVFASQGREATAALEDANVLAYSRRPLMLLLVDLVSRFSTWPVAFALVRLASIVVAYLALHLYLRLWFSPEVAVLGVFMVAASLPLTFVSNWWEILSDFPELLVFTLGLWSLQAGHALRLGLVCLLGTLNRETTGLLVVICALLPFTGGDGRRSLRLFAGALGGWLGTSLLLSAWLSAGSPAASFSSRLYLIRHNLRGLAAALSHPHPYAGFLLPVLMFGALWVLPLLAWRSLPCVLRAALCSVPFLLGVIVLVGGLNEPRQLIPLYPILVPGALFALFPSSVRGATPSLPSGAVEVSA